MSALEAEGVGLQGVAACMGASGCGSILCNKCKRGRYRVFVDELLFFGFSRLFYFKGLLAPWNTSKISEGENHRFVKFYLCA